MEILKLTAQNIHDQHICCAFSAKECAAGYQTKKDWLKTQFQNGYTFQKLDARGKVFIEYVPIEASWLPLSGAKFMVVNCFWVSGKFKGQGYGKELLSRCIEDAKALGMAGVVAISSDKKRPFMSDPRFFKRQGFEVVDEAPPYFQLYALTWDDSAVLPQILPTAKLGSSPLDEGITCYYSNTCPFTEHYNRVVLQEYADQKGVPLTLVHLDSQIKARQMPIPWIINSIFYQGKLVSLEIKPHKHLEKVIG